MSSGGNVSGCKACHGMEKCFCPAPKLYGDREGSFFVSKDAYRIICKERDELDQTRIEYLSLIDTQAKEIARLNRILERIEDKASLYSTLGSMEAMFGIIAIHKLVSEPRD